MLFEELDLVLNLIRCEVGHERLLTIGLYQDLFWDQVNYRMSGKPVAIKFIQSIY